MESANSVIKIIFMLNLTFYLFKNHGITKDKKKLSKKNRKCKKKRFHSCWQKSKLKTRKKVLFRFDEKLIYPLKIDY